MFCNINTVPLSVVKSVPSLLSAAEMLNRELPNISGSFINYAYLLCDDYFSKNQSTPAVDEAFNKLKSLVSVIKISNAKELEQFGDSILAAADDSSLPNEMYRLAYLSYAATSIHGPTSQRINQKMKRIESKIFTLLNSQNQNTQYQQANSQNNSNQIYPKTFNNYNLNNSQAHEKSMVSMPSYPSIDTPPYFGYNQPQPQNNNKNVQNNNNIIAQNIQYPQIPTQTNSGQNIKTEDHQRCKQLVEIARVAFKNGSLNIAYAAMMAAIQEIDKKT